MQQLGLETILVTSLWDLIMQEGLFHMGLVHMLASVVNQVGYKYQMSILLFTFSFMKVMEGMDSSRKWGLTLDTIQTLEVVLANRTIVCHIICSHLLHTYYLPFNGCCSSRSFCYSRFQCLVHTDIHTTIPSTSILAKATFTSTCPASTHSSSISVFS